MGYALVLVIHIIIAIFLIVVILLQGGRGGLGEALGGAAAQSLFGGGANTVMTKITAVCAGMFMVTCLSLAALSSQRGQSVIDRLPAAAQAGLPPTEAAIPSALPKPDAAPSPQTPSAPQPAAQAPAASSSTTK